MKLKIFTNELDTFCKLSSRRVQHTVEFYLTLSQRDGFVFSVATSNATFLSRNPFRALWSAVVCLAEAQVKYEAVKEDVSSNTKEALPSGYAK